MKMTAKKISDNGVAHCKRNGYYVQGIFQKYEKIFEQKKEKQNDKVFLNPIQRKIFRDLMYGTANYTPDELYKMNEDELITLIKRHRKTKRLIHILKCKKAYYIETKLLNLVFPHCQMGIKMKIGYYGCQKNTLSAN